LQKFCCWALGDWFGYIAIHPPLHWEKKKKKKKKQINIIKNNEIKYMIHQ